MLIAFVFYGMRRSFNDLCVQQCLYCINTNFRVIMLWGYLIFLLPLFRKFLEQSRPATLQMAYGFCDANNRDGFIGPNWLRQSKLP